ncbi:MAG: hypothetical protein CM15mP25_0040 [Gammaproteobacteria bacterium]|nr:MAG: hypothetical protein CM15mP25_0040 [Gammaproteobacteria bacterium]
MIANCELSLEAIAENQSRIAQAETALREQATATRRQSDGSQTNSATHDEATLAQISQQVQDDQRLEVLERDQARLNACSLSWRRSPRLPHPTRECPLRGYPEQIGHASGGHTEKPIRRATQCGYSLARLADRCG